MITSVSTPHLRATYWNNCLTPSSLNAVGKVPEGGEHINNHIQISLGDYISNFPAATEKL